MRKILLSCIMMLAVAGCSSSQPTITDTAISDEGPVTSQRILVQVYGLTDNYPISYSWSASGGDLEEWDETQYFAYWITPAEAGSYTVTCTIRDDDDNEDTVTFTVPVSERELVDDLLEPDAEVITLTKQKDSRIGGIWASIRGSNVRFLSSQVNEDTSWTYDLYVMLESFDDIFLDYALYGVESQGKEIIVQTSDAERRLTCVSCFSFDTISSLAIDVIDSSILWVGSDSGLHYYADSTETWEKYKILNVHDLFEGPQYTYAATDRGIYALGAPAELLYTGDTCTVYVQEEGESITVYSVNGDSVLIDGSVLETQPEEVVCSLDMDLKGNLWCGKYFWDGSIWQSPPGLEGIPIVKSVVSNEGLVYLLSESGSLFLW
ncbi:MAG: hypothetical protein ACP5G0_05775 [Desulfomonilia bacterium]